jgi:hypothetical protein
MLILVLSYFAVCVGLMALLGMQGQRYSAGLPLTYFLGMSLIHVPGAMLYLDAEETGLNAFVTQVGFEQAAIGMAAFLVGVIIARYGAFARGRLSREANVGESPQNIKALDRRAVIYLSVGGVAYFVLLPLLGGVATVTAVVASLGSLITVGTILRLWVARESRDRRKYWGTMSILPLLPLSTMVLSGFLGFGTYWLLTIAGFLFAQSKHRLRYILLTPVVFYIGLSVFVTYWAGRDALREVVWDQRAGLGDRIQRVVDTFGNFELFDLSNARHQRAVDARLNQNSLVGLAVSRLESGEVDYSWGSTIADIMVGLIPRVFWPDKPAVGGSGRGGFVEHYTGLEFIGSTSVGAGQVLEFYVNFGTAGVIAGFLLYGWLLGRMDLWIVEHFHGGDQGRLLVLFMVCVALLQPGGNLIEIGISAASAAITGYGINYFLNRRWRGKTSLPPVAAGRV